jgi:hypothetical protein
MFKHGVLAHVARSGYGLHVFEWLPGHVGSHAANSLHKQAFADGVGKAFDAYLPVDSSGLTVMFRYGRFIVRHAPEVSEGIHKYGLSIKNGQPVSSSFWGSVVWDEHRNHVHVGCTGR